ncbi:MAG: serpin family protein [Chloroflexota bacterium]|nr:serpin family protein [Chloroflexota bacterium]
MRKLKMLAALLLLSLTLAGAAGAQDDTGAAMMAGNVDFSLDFYQQVRGEEGNLFFSPYSILQAFWLAYAGADGSTAEQISEVLRLVPFDQLPAASGLSATPTVSGQGEVSSFVLRNANAVWGQQGFPWLPDYLAFAESNGSPVQLVDFTADPDVVRERINEWVEQQTEDKIQDLIPEGVIDAATRMVIANAIYFKAAWMFPFIESETQDAPFTLLDGTTQTVPMMQLGFSGETLAYVDGEGYSAVALPYVDGNTRMLIVLPDTGEFETFEAGMTADLYREISAALQFASVRVFMPRFSYEQSLSLASPLIAMGMTDAFSPEAANFGRMYDQSEATENLFISAALHKAFVEVNEEGTEAAAATGIIMGVTSVQVDPPIEVRIDRPFIFAIEDIRTSTLLFMGRVQLPGS